MVATHVLISLCVAAGLTAAAPQLDLPGVQRAVNQEALVSDVVTALEPSIAAAVANALRSLQTTTSIKATSSQQKAAVGGTAGKFAGPTADAAEPTARPEYNFEFKVADNEDQTYITQQEARDGDELTGSYSYVDPTGALITVNYQAGPDGFSQTSSTQEGFVQIVPKPPKLQASSASSASSSSSSSSGSKFSSAASNNNAAASGAAGFGSQASFSSQAANSATASLDQSALIAQILAALQPQISASVNAALSSSQQRVQSVVSVPVAAAAAPVAARPVPQAARPVSGGGNLASLFGDGYAVRIATPEFKIEY